MNDKIYKVLIDEALDSWMESMRECEMTMDEILDKLVEYRNLNWDYELRSFEYGYDYYLIVRPFVKRIPTEEEPKQNKSIFKKLFKKG